jgi:hypothetical protein
MPKFGDTPRSSKHFLCSCRGVRRKRPEVEGCRCESSGNSPHALLPKREKFVNVVVTVVPVKYHRLEG